MSRIDLELAALFEEAIGKEWIYGRAPSADTICVRITNADARRIICALRKSELEGFAPSRVEEK